MEPYFKAILFSFNWCSENAVTTVTAYNMSPRPGHKVRNPPPPLPSTVAPGDPLSLLSCRGTQTCHKQAIRTCFFNHFRQTSAIYLCESSELYLQVAISIRIGQRWSRFLPGFVRSLFHFAYPFQRSIPCETKATGMAGA